MSPAKRCFALHAEGVSRGSLSVLVHSAFAALGAYRRLRKACWPVVLITEDTGRPTDEAALLRQIVVPCSATAACSGNAARSSAS